jgi:hypothetical protein
MNAFPPGPFPGYGGSAGIDASGRQRVRCPRCGARGRPGDPWCGQCLTRFDTPAGSDTGPGTGAPPGAGTPGTEVSGTGAPGVPGTEAFGTESPGVPGTEVSGTESPGVPGVPGVGVSGTGDSGASEQPGKARHVAAPARAGLVGGEVPEEVIDHLMSELSESVEPTLPTGLGRLVGKGNGTSIAIVGGLSMVSLSLLGLAVLGLFL